MRKIGLFVAFLGICFVSTANAGIVTYNCDDDGDGAIVMGEHSLLNGESEEGIPVYDLNIACAQYDQPGHIEGDFTVNGDPIVWILEEVENATDFAWTDYHIAIGMSQTFSITSYIAPADWIGVISQPTSGQLLPNNTIGWLGYVDFYGGTPIQIGESGSFGIKTQFEGTVAFCTEQYPTPEPATMALLGFGGLALIRKRK